MDKLAIKISRLPKKPGVYQFLDKAGRVLYVGKAKNLRARVRQYLGDDSRPQIPFLMEEAAGIDYTVASSELEAAFLENTLIKQYSPKYNIDLKDDKNYAFIKIDYSTQIPQITYARKIDSPNRPAEGRRSMYFGPYSSAQKIRATLALVRKIFPFCAHAKISARPCFYYYMHRCPGVCIGKISLTEYQKQLGRIAEFLSGDIATTVRQIRTEMTKASARKKFETAARLRDQLRALEILKEKQTAILPKKVDWDIVSLAAAERTACINLFRVRGGKLFDKENFIYQLPADAESSKPAKILERFLQQYYLETNSLPKQIYLPDSGLDPAPLAQLIFRRSGKKIKLIAPKKNQPAKLLALGQTNAAEYLKNWLAERAGFKDRSQTALTRLQQQLRLPSLPRRIEAYDISNIQGTNAVGSMVVFKDGLPAKNEYRKFKIRTLSTPDDFAMMRETLRRRLERLAAQDEKFSRPDLIVIDGGKGQLGAALEILQNFQLNIPIIGLAKRIEEIFVPKKSQPVILSHEDPALQLLQRLRDEAHRFGITFHRNLRSKQAVRSALDEIPGLGPKTKKLLKAQFGTVAEIRQADLAGLAAIVGPKLAKIIKAQL